MGSAYKLKVIIFEVMVTTFQTLCQLLSEFLKKYNSESEESKTFVSLFMFSFVFISMLKLL